MQHPANAKIKAIGGATTGAVLQVGASLLKASGSLLNDAADVSSDLVRQKYGEQAGNATRESLHVFGNVAPLVQIPKLLVLGAMAETAGQMSGSVPAEHAKAMGALVPTLGTAQTPSNSPKESMPIKMALSESLSGRDRLPRPSELAAAQGGGIERVMGEAASAIEEHAVLVASSAACFVRQQTHELAAAAVEAVAPTEAPPVYTTHPHATITSP